MSANVVGKKGLEPSRVAPPEPKSGASASSATCPNFEVPQRFSSPQADSCPEYDRTVKTFYSSA